MRERRRGAALVEFAVMAPVFVVLTIGTIEAGNLLETSNIMSAAVREGGRLATMDWSESIPKGWTINDKVVADIKNFLTASGLPGQDMPVTITSADGDDSGDPFDLSDPDNQYRLFRIKVVYPSDLYGTTAFGFTVDGGLSQSMVFRAGRSQLTTN